MAATEPPMLNPGQGFLVTHDWTVLHCNDSLLETDSEFRETDRTDFETCILTITSANQLQAFDVGKGLFDIQNVKGQKCPLECLSDQATVSNPCQCQPLSGVVKCVYKVTHTLSKDKDCNFSDAALKSLQDIEKKMFQNKNVAPVKDVAFFLKHFGSHFIAGKSQLGGRFDWMLLVEKDCNMTLLNEIAKEVFDICREHESFFPASQDNVWYSMHGLLNTASWSTEKKQVGKLLKLRVSQSGGNCEQISFKDWKKSPAFHPLECLQQHETQKNIMSVWDMITVQWMSFQSFKRLASVLKDVWTKLVADSSHHKLTFPTLLKSVKIAGLGNPLESLLEDLGLEQYFPSKLSLQKVRSLHNKHDKALTTKDVPWKVLEQLILLNSRCLENVISEFAHAAKMKTGIPKKTFGRAKDQKTTASLVGELFCPHPMDMMLLLFTCADFMLRQVLARKLFMCRLAIPFLIPTVDDSIQMLVWPLRSIVMEWRDKHNEAMEESLVKHCFNMITFVRYGKTSFSKSKLINDVLSASSHSVFFHKEASLGQQKRLISNGMVEMSHFLPAGTQQDTFVEPALFFNLRGDACKFSRQHDLMCSLSTLIVIMIDIGELEQSDVKVKLAALSQQKGEILVILTDSRGHDEIEIEQRQELFNDLLGDFIESIEIVSAFEMEGGMKNISDIIQEVRESIRKKMGKNLHTSIEKIASVCNQTCSVDEKVNKDCQDGKEIANPLLAALKKIAIEERKRKLLPQQGDCLYDIGRLLRRLHRSSSKDTASTFHDKEQIKQSIKAIRQAQSKASNDDSFMKRVISMFQNSKGKKDFAIQWMQLELDSISRAVLPKLQSQKNRIWNELMAAKNNENRAKIPALEKQVQIEEKRVAEAALGIEHVMREVGQIYEVSVDFKKLDMTDGTYNLQSLPKIVASQLFEGYPLEIMDGDHGFLPICWVKAVFQSLAELVGRDKKVFVLSVLGVQSSGKSTLLNTMFGLEFAVSAGRCTRGIYAQLLPVDTADLPFDYMLVLDSEGLRAQELGEENFEHDNELATLVIGLADLALINLKGENAVEMTDVLQIVVHAFLRMKIADSPQKRQCMFVHQNVAAVNAQEKLVHGQQKLQEQLNTMTQQAAEAQGLAQSIMSFNKVIIFEGQRHVVYFSDLWNGDPPMATVNQGYSTRAAETRQRVLNEITNNFSGFITFPDFICRVEDMWNGVLTDDFVFSFRNSLAAKAYIGLEREFAKLTMQVESDLLLWVNNHCKIQIQNCKCQSTLQSCSDKLKIDLKSKVAEYISSNLACLVEFFEKHSTKEIIIQWKAEKVSSFKLFGQSLARQTETEIDNMKSRKMFELRKQSNYQVHEQEIVKRAMALAEDLRGYSPSDDELNEAFDDLWKKWYADLMSTAVELPRQVLHHFEGILWDHFSGDGSLMYFQQQIGRTPLVYVDDAQETLTIADISKEHIAIKDSSILTKLNPLAKIPSRADCFSQAVECANNILKKLSREVVDHICLQDTEFNPVHARCVIAFTLGEIGKFNDLPYKQAVFTVTPQFSAMLAIRAACFAAKCFDKMNQRFEERYGIKAQMEAYRQRVFVLFKNTVKQTTAEVTAAEDFSETIKAKVYEYVKMEMDQRVLQEILQGIGRTKYDLIIKMLDEIAEQESFATLHEYVTEPLVYATFWLQQYGEDLIFKKVDGKTKYSEIADFYVSKILADIQSGTVAATKTTLNVPNEEQYSKWIQEFCENMKDVMPFDSSKLQVATRCSIKNYENYQKILSEGFLKMEDEIKTSFLEVTKSTVKWMDVASPFLKARNRLWGCTELCPFCNEPCQDSDPNHNGSHRSVQHRPAGIIGQTEITTSKLTLQTCNILVTLPAATFECNAAHRQCCSSEHCNATGNTQNNHNFKDYKKFLPDWDISPDAAGDASKYWQWAICKFKTQLLAMYSPATLDIPSSWNDSTKKDAVDSLRVFR